MSEENQTDTEPAELTAADFEPQEGQEETAASESASTEETESQAAGEGEGEAQEAPAEEADPYADPPEFWAAEHKALWSKDLPPEFRAAVHEHVKQASRAISDKMMEAANARKAAEEQAQKVTQEREQIVQWMNQAGPALAQAIQGKWAGVDWQKLAAEDPAQYVQLKAAYDADIGQMQQFAQRHQQELQAAQERAKRQLDVLKRTEHEKLATSLPEHFGQGKAQATYDKLGKYLTDQGIDAQRVEAIYEAPVIAIALKAMLYDNAQAALKAQKPAGQPTATQTSKRIVPGARTGQPTKSDLVRQAEQRLRTGQQLSDRDVEALFG